MHVLHACGPARILVQISVDARGDNVLGEVGLEILSLRREVLVDRQIRAAGTGVDPLLRGAVTLGGHVLVLEQRVEIFVGIECELRAGTRLVLTPGVLAERVIEEGAALGRDERKSTRERVSDRAGECPFVLTHLTVAGTYAEMTLGFFAGLGADHVDRAGTGVATEKGRLGTTQHLDPFQIEERHRQHAKRSGHRDAVEKEADGAL